MKTDVNPRQARIQIVFVQPARDVNPGALQRRGEVSVPTTKPLELDVGPLPMHPARNGSEEFRAALRGDSP